jgi:hypothetical protein
MINQYELAAGWLVIKAFSSWIQVNDARTLSSTVYLDEASSQQRTTLNRYNEYVIGNALSLIIGVGIGLVARFLSVLLST